MADRALQTHEESLALRRSRGGGVADVESIARLAISHAESGEMEQAISLYEQAIEQAYGAEKARVLTLLGIALTSQGQFDRALNAYREAATILSEVGDRAQEAAVQAMIGSLAATYEQWAVAQSAYLRAQTLSHDLGNAADEAAWLGELGNVFARTGQPGQAASYYRKAVELARSLGDSFGEGRWLEELAGATIQQAQIQPAIQVYERAIELARQMGDQRNEAVRLVRVAFAYAALGASTNARALARQARAIFVQLGNPDDLAWCDDSIAELGGS
jgi:tetratricopeptide (TPR) repeat protein